jgi:hypothetical protein
MVCFAVQHCTDFSNIQDICNLLECSSLVRQELQQARLDGLVVLDVRDEIWHSRVHGFEQWLHHHAGLVARLELRSREQQLSDLEDLQNMCAATLQRHRRRWRRHCRAVAAAAGGAASPAPLQPLQLRSVLLSTWYEEGDSQASSDYGELDWLMMGADDGVCYVQHPLLKELAAANTVKLRLESCYFHASTASTGSLSHLTSLQELWCGTLEPCVAHSLPCSLRSLAASFVASTSPAAQANNDDSTNSSSTTRNSSCLDLQYLTQLQQLSCLEYCGDAGPPIFWPEVRLPPQLSRLDASAPLRKLTGHVAALASVRLACNVELLPFLGALPSPLELDLRLPIRTRNDPTGERYAAEAAAAISTASQLTALSVASLSGERVPLDGWCDMLASLPRLQKLQFHGTLLLRQDLLQLTRLASLRSLCLRDVHVLGDAPSATAVRAVNPVRLTALRQQGYSIAAGATALLVVVGRLTRLHSLTVCWICGATVGDAELALLSQLTQLTSLALRPLSCSADIQQQSLAGMPKLGGKIGSVYWSLYDFA